MEIDTQGRAASVLVHVYNWQSQSTCFWLEPSVL